MGEGAQHRVRPRSRTTRPCGVVTGTMTIPVGCIWVSWAMGPEYVGAFTIGDQFAVGAAELPALHAAHLAQRLIFPESARTPLRARFLHLDHRHTQLRGVGNYANNCMPQFSAEIQSF